MNQLLTGTAVRAARYVEGIPTRRVLPLPESIARLEGLGGPLLEDSCDPATLIALLDDLGRRRRSRLRADAILGS